MFLSLVCVAGVVPRCTFTGVCWRGLVVTRSGICGGARWSSAAGIDAANQKDLHKITRLQLEPQHM